MLNPRLRAMTLRWTNDEKMEKYIFNYDEWLSGHAKRKTMMQKLERSLIPFEIFDAIVKTGVSRNGHFEGYYLQPIATALYQYSYLLRWKGLQQ